MNLSELKVIWVNGMPRSGTSWLAQIFDSSSKVNFKMAPLFSYTFKNAVNLNSTNQDWTNFLNEVHNSNDSFLNQIERKEKGDFQTFNKENNPEYLCIKDVRNHQLMERFVTIGEHVKIVHIVRNPCAMISSWINSKKEFIRNEKTLKDEWKTGNTRKIDKSEFWGFNDWINLTKFYLALSVDYPTQVFIVKYEDLVRDPISITKDIFNFCGLEFEEQTRFFLSNSHSIHHDSDYSVFKDPTTVLNQWKSKLPKEISKEIIEICTKERLASFLDNE